MKPTDEELMAYADGELGAADAARIEAAMAVDPEMAAAVARARTLRAQLRQAFDPMLAEPVPAHLTALARGAAPAATVPVLPQASRRRWALPEWAALAAALVLGVAVSQFGLRPAAGPLDSRDGRLLASGALAESLDSRLGADSGGAVRIGLSFRTREGGYCRGFRLQGERDLAGLACRADDGRWQVPVLVAADPAPEGGLRQAASALPGAVLAEVDARIVGEPLDAAQEREARDAGWR